MRWRVATDVNELHAQGLQPVDESRCAELRRLGVPITRCTMRVELASPKAPPFWAPVWAVDLVNDWPLSPAGDDYDHFTLKRVIARIVRSGDYDSARGFITVASLGGEQAVLHMLQGTNDA